MTDISVNPDAAKKSWIETLSIRNAARAFPASAARSKKAEPRRYCASA
jgi:hypothetical protein